MGLNIKNAAVESEIRALAAETGESLTDAIAAAVHERLMRIRMQKADGHPAVKAGEAYRARLEVVRAALKAKQIDQADTRSGAELEADLYDEHGLPK